MSNIKTLKFTPSDLSELKSLQHGMNWPAVYLIEDGKEIYIGQTWSVYNRSRQHIKNPDRAKLKNLHIISDDEYNISATLDIESALIQYLAADGVFTIQNANKGLSDHDYYDKQKYQAKIELIWDELKSKSIAINDLVQIRNSDLFKYSPYKSLTPSQLAIADEIFNHIKKDFREPFVVLGGAGTGKTILAVYILKYLKDSEATKNLKIGLVVPMTSLRKTIKKVFRNVKGLSPNMVISPNAVVGADYDILLVDEAHRLHQRRSIVNYKTHDISNAKLGLGNEGDELDWVLKSSKHQILFYDPNQHVRPSDIAIDKIPKLTSTFFQLPSQLRIQGGEDAEHYVKFVYDLFDLKKPKHTQFNNYDFSIYDDLSQMVVDIKIREREYTLARIISGYAWEWQSQKNPDVYDIVIGDVKLKWNSVTENWVYSKNAINEVGCIHTVQGYDLNYAGVIIGPELGYDLENKKFIIRREHYKDANGHRGIDDPKELERYILNIYKTLMLRGIKGTYVYIVDPGLREYLRSLL